MPPSNGLKTKKKRLLQVTSGNVRHSHLYVNGHYDFFPPDCIGGAKRAADSPTIDIHLDGLNRTIRTTSDVTPRLASREASSVHEAGCVSSLSIIGLRRAPS